MGSWAGHVLPGTIFLVRGVWWYLNVLFIYGRHISRASRGAQAHRHLSITFKSSTWFEVPLPILRKFPCESIVLIMGTLLGIGLELSLEHGWVLTGKNGDFEKEHLNNYAHAAMYGIFLLASLLETLQFFKVLTLPDGAEHMAFALALIVEGLLFYFHVDGRPVLEKRLHTLLFVVVFLTAIVLLLEAWQQNSFLLLVVRVHLVLLQGTWFYQIAHSLFGKHPWNDSGPNREFVSIAFAWHVLTLMALSIGSFTLVSLMIRGCKRAANEDSRVVDTEVKTLSETDPAEKCRLIDVDQETQW